MLNRAVRFHLASMPKCCALRVWLAHRASHHKGVLDDYQFMLLRKFIQKTRLLLVQAMHESRCALRLTDGPTLESVTATQLEERILMSVSPVAVAQATQDAGTTDVSASTNADAFALSQLSLDVA